MLNFMNLIDKRTGGQRVVGATSILYRMVSSVLSYDLKQFEKFNFDSFDTTRKGSSVEFAATGRAMQAEVARYKGQRGAGIFVDIRKYFESISPEMLIKNMQSCGFPMWRVSVCLPVHIAPRRLCYNGVVSKLLSISSSTLLGCTFSVTWVRGLLRNMMRQAVESSTKVTFATQVDDIVALTFGERRSVFECVTKAGVELCLGVDSLNLQLAEKSTVVATSLGLAEEVAGDLANLQIDIAALSSVRGVGVKFTCASFPDRSLIAERKETALRCVKGARSLMRVDKKAGMIVRSAALPMQEYGQAA